MRVKARHWRLWLILLLAFGLRLYRLDQQSLWWDELKTWERTVLSLPDMWQNLLTIGNR